MANSDKQADLAGPGVSTYEAVSKILPENYKPLQSLMERMKALFEAKRYIEDGYPHEMRAADYDDWATETITKNGETMHGLNGDILVWNPITQRRHELTSMGIRVNKESLKIQLKIAGQEDFFKTPLSSGPAQRRNPFVHRRRYWSIQNLYVFAADCPSW